MNTLSKHLEKYLDSDVQVSRRWPSDGMQLPPKQVSCIFAGPRKDIELDPQIIRQTDGEDPATTVTWRLRFCEQPIQLDVWARKDSDRDDLVATLDDILNFGDSEINTWNPIGVDNGTVLKVEDGWVDTYVNFYFDSPENLDTPDSAIRSEYRSSYSGSAFFMLTVDRESVKQKILELKIALDDCETPNTITLP